jgi:hypothetical protein
MVVFASNHKNARGKKVYKILPILISFEGIDLSVMT